MVKCSNTFVISNRDIMCLCMLCIEQCLVYTSTLTQNIHLMLVHSALWNLWSFHAYFSLGKNSLTINSYVRHWDEKWCFEVCDWHHRLLHLSWCWKLDWWNENWKLVLMLETEMKNASGASTMSLEEIEWSVSTVTWLVAHQECTCGNVTPVEWCRAYIHNYMSWHWQ